MRKTKLSLKYITNEVEFMSRELLIIGNGFDLQAGLETKYENFFKNRYNQKCIEEIELLFSNGNDDLIELKKIKGLNFWDLFFLLTYIYCDSNNTTKNWADIEREIRNFLVYDINNENITKRKLLYYIFNDHNSSNEKNVNKKTLELVKKLEQIQTPNKLNLDEFLFKELLVFEKNFGEYVNDQMLKNLKYKNNSNAIIDKLVHSPKETFVLSFNYTEVQKNKIEHVEYVHGESTKDIIFGIDTNGLKSISEEYRYTKTYRKLLMNVENQKHVSLPKNVFRIVFFGHSLSDADFSYFQSIFDFYSIYDSNIGLEFHFSIYNESERQEIVSNQLNAVTNLFSKYGEKMMNSHQGENMLHKLILENRIKIIEF